MSAHELRLGRLFSPRSGRSFIAALDHGVTLGVPQGAEDALATVQQVIKCQPDGVLMGPGLFAKAAHLFAHRGAPNVLIRTDFILNHPYVTDHGEGYRTLITPEEAAGLGADAAVMFLVLGPGREEMFADNIAAIARSAQAAHRAGIPLIVEAVLWGSRIENQKDPDRLAFACRMAVEIGADAIKTEFSGGRESMRQIINSTPAPVLVLGGLKSTSPTALIDATRDALEAGAKGVIYGRNIWQADDPAAVAKELRQIIHAPPANGRRSRAVVSARA